MVEWCTREGSYFPDAEFEIDADGHRVHRVAPRHWAATGALIDESEPGPIPTDFMEDPDRADSDGTDASP